jgi:integrase
MRTGRKPKGPRLYLRDRTGREPVWVIRDGASETGTGCGAQDRAGADEALQAYLASKYAPPSGPTTLDRLLIADVVNIYVRERAPHVAEPGFIRATALPVLEWWAGKHLSDVKGNACREYVAWRTQAVSLQTARHDLKTLRAAINHYHAEHGPLPAVPVVSLPEKAPPRDRWLTRGEAARLLLAAWRRKETRHVARFVLIALYTGTRSAAVLGLRWLPATTGGHVDLERGVLYRRGTGQRETKKRRPPVRLPDRLLGHLRRWHRIDARHAITHVVHYQGSPCGKMRRSWGTVRAAAGLGQDVTPHTMRHTCCTWLMQAGVEIFEAAGFLGMSAATLEQVYGHHHEDYQNAAATGIGRRPQNAPGTDRQRARKTSLDD